MRTWPSGQPLRVALTGLLTAALTPPARAAEPPPVAAHESASEPADTKQAEAIRLFREARALYTAGQPREAALAFEGSFAAAASPEAAYNAALAHDKTDDALATLKWFRRYLEIAQKDTDPSYPLAVARAAELRARVGELRVELERPGEVREIRVNGQPVPLDSFPRLVIPGRVELQFIGAGPGQVVDIASDTSAGETATIYFPGFAKPVAKPDPQPLVRPPAPPPEPKPNKRLRALKIAFWTSAGATGASAILMAAFGGVALREFKLWKTGACIDNVCPPDFVDHDTWMAHHTAADRYDDYTNVMIGVTSGLAVVSLALGIAALRESRRPRASTRARFLPGPGGLLVAF
jgi:hypothetical protein